MYNGIRREVIVLKIAVCDDEMLFLKKLKQQISEILVNGDYSISEFFSGEQLIEAFPQERFDIVILDIEMEGINGIDTAKTIRNIDSDVAIAFLTSHETFAIQGYEVNAKRYILKQQPEYMYREQLTALFMDYNQNHKRFSYNKSGVAFSVKVSDIIYFEVFNRKIVLHSLNGDLEYYGKIADLRDEYESDGFIKVGKSFLINAAHIRFIDKNDIILKNGTKISIGRNIKSQIVEEYLNYLSGK